MGRERERENNKMTETNVATGEPGEGCAGDAGLFLPLYAFKAMSKLKL